MAEDPNFSKIILFSIAFQLLMGAFLTMGAIEKAILQSVADDDPTFEGDGFISLALIYAFFGLSNFIAPTIVNTLGVKRTLLLASIPYGAFIAGFLYPRTWLLYATSVLLGLAAGCLWVSNGVYFTKCNTAKTMNKNMGIYWTIQSSGVVLGSAFVFWRFNGVSRIDPQLRFWVTLILACVSALGTLLLCFLGEPVQSGSDKDDGKEDQHKNKSSIMDTLTGSFRLLSNKHMLLLIPPSLYSGLEVAVYSAIYPAAVGFTEGFGSDAKKYVGFAGILIGIGTMAAGFIFGIVGSRIFKSRSRSVGVIVAGISHCAAIAMIYANLTDSSASGPTSEESLISPPSVKIAMACALLLGLGDGCLMPQMMAVVGVIWPEDPSTALALFRFFQGGCVGVVFFVSNALGLHKVLMVFLGIALVGTGAYLMNERLIAKEQAQKQAQSGSVAEKGSEVVKGEIFQVSVKSEEIKEEKIAREP